jgi:hypothetical protein
METLNDSDDKATETGENILRDYFCERSPTFRELAELRARVSEEKLHRPTYLPFPHKHYSFFLK